MHLKAGIYTVKNRNDYHILQYTHAHIYTLFLKKVFLEFQNAKQRKYINVYLKNFLFLLSQNKNCIIIILDPIISLKRVKKLLIFFF